MKNIIPVDTRYLPFAQQKSCCVPASLSIIMYKLGIPLVPQELLGYYLGLIVDKENKHLFWHPRTGKRPKTGYGSRIGLKQYEPNTAFKKLGIPLKMTIRLVSEFKNKKDFIAFIVDGVKKNKDILACFHHGVLGKSDSASGHVCVIDRIFVAKNKIRLIDSSVNQPKWREVSIDRLMKAMEQHPGKQGGFWLLDRI